jgi:hypothetical protein
VSSVRGRSLNPEVRRRIEFWRDSVALVGVEDQGGVRVLQGILIAYSGWNLIGVRS